ncbi:MAG TPA: tRNA (adenine(22)-N(1))-methyltransferase TrmK [Candidatus Solibacter sp.]|jgi:tRNA (adenine22-N1)-methyltransferase|nr:tRNA (adenine(22)-N(1))-methyltransferase TrmK [Candidatus Solibacter sp.]
MRLSARLRGVLDLVPAYGAVADIGSGHGALAAAVAARGQRVLATERTPGRVESLRRDMARRGIPVATRRGEGLAALRQGEVDIAVIAGLGGRNLVAMLESSPWLPRWLVLQPVQDAAMVEDWICAKGFAAVSDETTERGRRYRTWRVDVPAAAGRVRP